MHALGSSASPREMAALLWRTRLWWASSTTAGAALAAAVALMTPRMWQATQPMSVRQEAAASRTNQPGKFSDLYEMRTLQETMLEIARSRQVVESTLKVVHKRQTGEELAPIDAETLGKFRKRLDMLPPGGAEFGKTEIFYFSVKDPDRERAVALVAELGRQLDVRLRELLLERAAGLTAELRKQVEAEEEHLDEQTVRLQQFEADMGADLGELRLLHSAASGQSDLRQQVVALENDVRRYEAEMNDALRLERLLTEVQQEPDGLASVPNSLLATHPALTQLKDGPVASQLNTARLNGSRSAEHPRVRAAVEAEERIRRKLQHQIEAALEGAAAEVELGRQRCAAAQQELAALNARLEGLAARRAEYSNRAAAVDVCRQSTDAARQKLSAAIAAQAAAASAALATPIDAPESGAHPLGPGRTVVTAAGACGGLLLGLGSVLLLVPPPADPPSARAAPRRRPRAAAAGASARTSGPERRATAAVAGSAACPPAVRPAAERPAERCETPAAEPAGEPAGEWWDAIDFPDASRASAAAVGFRDEPASPAAALLDAARVEDAANQRRLPAAALPRLKAVADFAGMHLRQAQQAAGESPV